MPLDMGAPLVDPSRVAREVMAEAWQPPPRVDYLRWAVENVVFGQESPFPGPFDPSLFPWFPGILEACGPEHPARCVYVMGSAQGGKTTVGQIFVGGSLDLDPGPFLYTHPTTDNGKRWVKQKWRVMVRQTTALKRIFSLAQSRDASSSLDYIERLDGKGYLQVSGANSQASLSMMSMTKQVQDDLSKWEMNPAGDPESQADTRSKAFDFAKILKLGTPLVAPGCRISAGYKRSTQGEFHVPCPHCEFEQPLRWENFRNTIDKDHPERAHFTCDGCGAAIEQKHRDAIVRRGRWVMKNPAAAATGVYGFYIWTAYARTESWASLARRWLDAQGDPAKEQAFLNDDAGLAYEAQGEAPPWEALYKRAEASEYQLGKIPVGGLLLVISVDCQADRMEWHAKAFGRDLKRWTVEYGVIEGHISDDTARAALDKLRVRTWPDSFGNRRSCDIMAIDAGYAKSDVHDFAKRHPVGGKMPGGVMMVRGVHGDNAPELALVREERTQDGKLVKFQNRFWNVGAAPLKSSLYRHLQKTDPTARGFCAYPAGLKDEFFRQLTAERRQPVKLRSGFTEWRWVKVQGQPNEVLDTEIYAEAGAIRLGWKQMQDKHWDALQARLEVPASSPQLDLEDPDLAAPPVPQNGPDARTRRGPQLGRRRSNFATSW
jgi:phage terminase large subunit GpA-like protein